MEILILGMLVMMGAMLFMGTRKQKKQMAQIQEMQAALTTGTRIQLMSGLFGTVIDANDEYVDVEISPGVVGRWTKLAVRSIVDLEDAAQTYVGAALEVADADDEDAQPELSASDEPTDDK
ncbi:MAG TPA: preprotein translocase subunit YajC [Gordonia sp. (in: high G+C Gram-positive bacteria)]|uniref:preprotein translocase subunit YajC n=1 Tax=unclassified Gordonia (in: high G+C Gram-positive bacteria) TaxID=2657482 RepID=UPI000F9E3712|nr:MULTISPECIES: preprotein translocase subunit YajC [unclassified Gordonia (in: high G+C Gram-positive bacteria)]RUP35760.1 MAG: preprotein translocase subunit YajC [Gordonia sp. (in: high G+C Gram-positive bacteria)]HNP57752.1 preprotein translocase subunit YajC [Gordonia sp. (in: high G+C Gram-positive bacteria)]HRC50442.1 preprotein translocase subunit YajC [Gordonia sp. (in: high G+C Gram-positive bacteria)]